MSTQERGPVTYLIDVALASGTGAIVAMAALQAHDQGSRHAEPWVLALCVAGLLLVRRRYPVVVLLGLTAATVAYNMTGFAGIGFVWPLLVGLFTAASAGRLLTAVLVAAGSVALDTGWLLVAERHPVLPVLDMAAPDAVMAGLAIALGDAVHSRRRRAAETRERLRQVSREKDRQAQQAIVEQRLRIAREIHDVTAHTLAVVAVQINVAADALPDEPAKAEQALDIARTVSHQSMGELRAAVQVLRAPDAAEGLEEPMPGLADLPRLVEEFGAGPRIRLRESGEPRPVPVTVELTAYRIVQEALTNVVKHARADKVEVTVDHGDSAIVVRIADDGQGGGDASPETLREKPSPGNGLIGLSERAAGVGGTLEAGPSPEGGFVVEARLPLGGR